MFRQEMPAGAFEIVIVVDGSTDGSAQALREVNPPCPLRVIEQTGRGASAARNQGIQAAQGDLLLFIDDDIVCGPDLFRLHVNAHNDSEPSVVHGSIAIDPETPESLLKYSTQSWYEQYYDRLAAQNGLKLPEDNFLISNSSMPRQLVIDCGGFDENLKAKEDYEIGLRLWKSGVPFKFLPQSKAYEYFQKPAQFVMRNDGRVFGETEILLSRKHPEYRPHSRFASMGKTPWSKRALRRILAEFPLDLTSVLNLPLSIFDRLSRFPVMRRAGDSLLGIGRSIIEIRSAVEQAGSWRAFEREFGVALPSLLYHHVGPARPGSVPGLTISAAKFEQQMQWLADRGYTGICPTAWLQWLREGKGLPDKPILITFDDAYADTAEYALPILKKYGFGAAVFVVTERLGGTNTWDESQGSETLQLMTAEQIRNWAGQGIEFGGHSRTHAYLTQLSDVDLAAEVAGCEVDLFALLGCPVLSFAYPYGEYNDAVRDVVQQHFKLAFTVEEGLNYLAGDPFLIRRAYVGPGDSLAEFALSARRGGTRKIRDWRIKLALRTRLRRGLGIDLTQP
jgi:peptidoglycan/xylan/chitin deacetylase (PgdA/CDA1 family)/glycosyltransferase involved in cell wall biosynthesis